MFSRPLATRLFSLLAICLIAAACTPKERSYNKGHNDKPNSGINFEIETQRQRVSDEISDMLQSLEADNSSAFQIYEQLKTEIYESEEILSAQSISSEDTAEKVRVFNQAVVVLIEDRHPELPTVLQNYEAALFKGCELNQHFRGCERLHLFKLAANSSLVSLSIAQSYRSRDLWRYFDFIDLTFALKSRDSSEGLMRIYVEDFPSLYTGVRSGVLTIQDNEQWRQRILRFNTALCQVNEDRQAYSEQTQQALARAVFNFEPDQNDFPSVRQDCITDQIGGSVLSDSNSETLLQELRVAYDSAEEIAESEGNTTVVLPSIFEILKTNHQEFSIQRSLHMPALDLDTIQSSQQNLFLFFVIDQSFHQGISTQFAAQLLDELQAEATSQEEFRDQVYQMIRSYMGHYLVSLAYKTHSDLGAYFQSSTKTEVAFVNELVSRSATFRSAWRNYQDKVEDLYEAVEASLLNDYRGQQQELPEDLVQIQDLLLSAPDHVKFVGDIPAHIMLAVEMGRKNWNVDFRGSIYSGATEMRDLIDGGPPGSNTPKYSWFTFSRPQIEAMGVPMSNHEVLYGFDYLFRLSLSELYGMNNSVVVEVIAQQYMASAFQQSRNNFHFDFITDRVQSFENFYNSSRMDNARSVCQKIEAGETFTVDMHPDQYKNLAAVGYPFSSEVDGKATMAQMFGYLFMHAKWDPDPFGMRSDKVSIFPMFDNAEYVRTTALPRMNRVRNIMELLSKAVADQGQDAEGITESLMEQFVYPHYNRVFNMMDIYENQIPALMDCNLDLIQIENKRRDHLLLGELEYYKTLQSIGALIRLAFNNSQLESNMAELRGLHPSHEAWSHLFVRERLNSATESLTALEFLDQLVNTPHPQLQASQTWLKGVLAQRKAYEFDPNTGALQFNLTKQRFAYRARRYYEQGFEKDGQLRTLDDLIVEDYSSYPDSYIDIENSKLLRNLFNSTGHKISWSSRTTDFMRDISQKFYDKIIVDWYGVHTTFSIVHLFFNHRLTTSLARSKLERMKFQRQTCDSLGLAEGCEDEILSDILSEAISRNVDIFALLVPPEGQTEFLKTFGHPHIFYTSLGDNRGLGYMGYTNMRLFIDADVRPLPYFDYQYALFTSPFVGQSDTRIRGRIDPSNALAGSSFWEKKLYEFRRALDYYNSNKRPSNHFGLNLDGSIRVDEQTLNDHRDRVLSYMGMVDEFRAQVQAIGSENMPPYAVFNNETPRQLPMLNPDMVQVVNDEFIGFHCETENMFASPESRCP
ncbi:MAG: hypothetical protein HRT45_13280 [Bdellovibrionales bacterium]|nr:hypothetical protein [Bdellovibrionales bacterium]